MPPAPRKVWPGRYGRALKVCCITEARLGEKEGWRWFGEERKEKEDDKFLKGKEGRGSFVHSEKKSAVYFPRRKERPQKLKQEKTGERQETWTAGVTVVPSQSLRMDVGGKELAITHWLVSCQAQEEEPPLLVWALNSTASTGECTSLDGTSRLDNSVIRKLLSTSW